MNLNLRIVINITHILIYNSPISAFAIQSSLETSYNEATEFIIEFCSISNIVYILAISAFLLFLMSKAVDFSLHFKRNKYARIFACLLICILSITIFLKGKRLLNSNFSYVIINTALNYVDDIKNIKSLKENRKQLTFDNVTLLDGKDTENRTYVFIVGESMNKNHMSLYGYFRHTTPFIDKREANSELATFKNVVSASTHTVPSLRKTLLFNDLEEKENLANTRSFIGLLKSAGFTTYWLSNQTANSDGLSGTALIAGDADSQKFFNHARHEGNSVSYDEVLLPAFKSALEDKANNKAIFLHFIGSHLTYHLRYPKSFAFYQSVADIADAPWRTHSHKKYINEYDNSIRYTDYIVNELITILEKQPGRNMLVYFSDHGQEVYDTLPIRGQDARNPTRNMFDIPFFCWFSNSYKEANKNFLKSVDASLGREFSLENFSQSAAELTRIGFSEFSSQRSLFSSDYILWPRTLPQGGTYDNLPKLQ